MRTPEEVAREVLGCRLTLANDGRNVCETEHGGAWDCTDEEQRIADLIRARDAEVREEARFEALALFEVERSDHMVARRLVGPWKPEP